jgi:hypothetical protein
MKTLEPNKFTGVEVNCPLYATFAYASTLGSVGRRTCAVQMDV